MRRISLFLALFAMSLGASYDGDFIKSFVGPYDCTTSGRYTHEYHPFLLKKTAESLRQLENHLEKEGFRVDGRVVIMGYEGNAIPSYFPSFRDCEGGIIDDEYVAKELRGWSLQLHNRFGLMSGFLFRDVNRSAGSLFRHINPHRTEIFYKQMSAFQRDSFGPLYSTILSCEQRVLNGVAQDKWRDVFGALAPFWSMLYDSEGKTGDTQVAGTQDILFTAENTRFLKNSDVPLIKFYTGGDITYPIVLSKYCGRRATFNAQCFVKEFIETLKPRDGEPTVFIFKSFVDGVGKSTLLGNIQNFKKFGNDIDRYESVDNTSSLVAEMFEFAPGVHIADLPAQMSHFTHKPDGLVYVDLGAVGDRYGHVARIQSYFDKHKNQLLDHYKSLVLVARSSNLSEELQEPEKVFVQNLVLLKRTTRNYWIPLNLDGRDYLVDKRKSSHVRVLLPLPDARSEGLKNVEPEQMLFTNGVGFPPPYKMFLDDLVEKCRSRGIKRAVFVDFLSMYSRSSRENIRINYLLQQLARIVPKFNLHDTLYRNFSSNSELLALLKTDAGLRSVAQALEQETQVRLAFHKMMEEATGDMTRVLTNSEALQKLRQHMLSSSDQAILRKLVSKKIAGEADHLERTYGDTKEFLNVHSFSFDLLLEFSDFMQDLFSCKIRNRHINSLWSGLGREVLSDESDWEEGAMDKIMRVKDGDPVRVLFAVFPENRNPAVLDGLFRLIRTAWYDSLCNLVYAEDSCGTGLRLEKERIHVLPILVKRGTDGAIYVVQKLVRLDNCLDKRDCFDDQEKMRFGLFDGARYPLDLCAGQTSRGIYAFGSNVFSGGRQFPNLDSMIYSIVWQHQYNHGAERVMSTSDVYRKFAEYMGSSWGGWMRQRLINVAEKSQKTHQKEDSSDSDLQLRAVDAKKASKQKKMKVAFWRNEQREALSLFARAISTLEMVVRDVRSDIVVQRGDRDDYSSALKLVEDVVLVQHFGLLSKEPLFSRGARVEPVVPWIIIDRVN